MEIIRLFKNISKIELREKEREKKKRDSIFFTFISAKINLFTKLE